MSDLDLSQDEYARARKRFDLDHEEVDEMYSQLSQLSVDLDLNPLDYGPRRLNNKIAETRSCLSTTEGMFVNYSAALAKYKRAFNRYNTQLELTIDEMLRSDKEVMSGSSMKDRQAIARSKVGRLVRLTIHLKNSIEEMDDLIKVVKSKRTDLRDTERRLKDQINLCHDEINNLGQNWGSKVPKADASNRAIGGESATVSAVPDADKVLSDAIADEGSDDDIFNLFGADEDEPAPKPPKVNEVQRSMQTSAPGAIKDRFEASASRDAVDDFFEEEDADERSDLVGVADEDFDLDDIISV